MKLKFADAIVPVKMLKIGTVVFEPCDIDNKLNKDEWIPVHIMSFRMGADGNIELEIQNCHEQKYIKAPENLCWGDN